MPRELTRVRSGNHVRVVMDGQTVGLVQSLSCSDDYGLEPASGVGDIHVQEYVPTVARHSLQASMVVLKNDALVARGFVPENGDEALRGLVFDIEIYDKRGGELLKKYINASVGSSSTEIGAHRTIMRNVQMMALDVSGKL